MRFSSRLSITWNRRCPGNDGPALAGEILMNKIDLLRRAITLAAQARPENGDEPFGAVVARDGVIVGEGRNLVGSTLDPTAHSEIVAIRDACRRLDTVGIVRLRDLCVL